MVIASNSSMPASPSTSRKRTRLVDSHGGRGSKYSWPLRKLVIDVLRPPLAHRLVALVVRMLELQQCDHQSDRQTPASDRTDTPAGQRQRSGPTCPRPPPIARPAACAQTQARVTPQSAPTAYVWPALQAGGEGRSWRQDGYGKNRAIGGALNSQKGIQDPYSFWEFSSTAALLNLLPHLASPHSAGLTKWGGSKACFFGTPRNIL